MSGASMALVDPALDNNVGDNWCTASTPTALEIWARLTLPVPAVSGYRTDC